ncbi:ATP-binding protein [Paenibacillus sp. CN-4]|uniref:ATP-binding protein n=1 Tax=Paenibacillus nanchangensis TaxID=3348343 RepID=UPI00397BCDF0
MKSSAQKTALLQILIVAAGTAIAGEFKFNPFVGDLFRIGLGSSAFLLFLLLMRQLPYALTGLVTGVFVLMFRMGLDRLQEPAVTLIDSLQRHGSAMVYYVVFALCMKLIKSRIDTFHPLILGLLAAMVDLISNEMELLARLVAGGTPSFRLGDWAYLMAVAMLRTYFTTGLYSSVSVYKLRAVQGEQNRRIEQMLGFGSGLYGEVFYLRKSIDTLEQVTLDSYSLYNRLKEDAQDAHGRKVLDITQRIHEVKKDSQRILAGLVRLVDREDTADMPLSGIIRFTLKSNAKYAELVGKSVFFSHNVMDDYATPDYIPLLTLLNNLTANAVESIRESGSVTLDVYEQGGITVFSVSDTGRGIDKRDMELLFEPGFTTKFNEEGVAATGIGLSHVRDIVNMYGGEIAIAPSARGKGTLFQVKIPTDKLRKEE